MLKRLKSDFNAPNMKAALLLLLLAFEGVLRGAVLAPALLVVAASAEMIASYLEEKRNA